MTRLHFSLQPRHDAVCPVCCHPLVSDIWIARHNIAFCSLCADSELEAIRRARIAVRWVCRHHHNGALWHIRCGILFYIGQHPLGLIPPRLNEYAHQVGDALL